MNPGGEYTFPGTSLEDLLKQAKQEIKNNNDEST